MPYVETSAKSNTNVDEAFFKLAQQVKDHLVEQGITTNAPGTPGAQQLTGGAAERLKALTPAGHDARIDLSITDDWPLAQAFVIISAVSLATS